MTAARLFAIRGVFAATMLSLPVMLVVRERVGEPYPGLYQPAFDGSTMRGDVYRTYDPRISVRDASGVTRRIAVSDLVDAPRVPDGQVDAIVRSTLRDRDRARRPAAVRDIRDRLVELGIDAPVRMRVTWYSTGRAADGSGPTGAGRARQSYVVRLDR